MIQVEWDYTELVDSYGKRPPYSAVIIEQFLAHAGLSRGMMVCDVGAGTGNLTVELLSRNLKVVAVEPNPRMRDAGRERTRSFQEVQWVEATGESTGQPEDCFDGVTFGSSFNVVDRSKALLETDRILRPRGWLACLWNYRDLSDQLQSKVEKRIQALVENYQYGSRREDQSAVILASGVFKTVKKFEHRFQHVVSLRGWMEAWKSHATLRRQAGELFPAVLTELEKLLHQEGSPILEIPYITGLWLAQKRN